MLLLSQAVKKISDWDIVPRLYYVCESELSNEVTTVGSSAVAKQLKMEPMKEDVPFLWAQALYLIARLTRKFIVVYFLLTFN